MKLLLHIGLEKTGSTSLQSFIHEAPIFMYGNQLANQRDLFKNANHIDLALSHVAKRETIENLKRYSTVSKLNLMNWIMQRKNNHIFLSNEHISSRLSSIMEYRDLMNTLTAGDHEVIFIIVMRKVHNWRRSKYIEAVKNGYAKKFANYIADGGQWHERELDLRHLNEIIEELNVVSKVFDYSKDVNVHILEFVDRETNSNFSKAIKTNTPKELNVSYNRRQLIVKRYLNYCLFLSRVRFLNIVVDRLVRNFVR